MQLEIYTDSSGFATLKADWNTLLERSITPTIFLTWEWQTVWWEHLGEGDLFVIAGRAEDGRLAGVTALFCSITAGGARELSFVGCADVSDYLDVIVTPDEAEEFYAALLDWLRSPSAPDWDRLDLCNIPEASPTHTRLAALAQARGYPVKVALDDVCPLIRLPSTWDDYLAALDKKERHEIRRKIRKAEREAQVDWHIVDDHLDLETELDDFLVLHAQSKVEKRRFMDDRMRAFFHASSRLLADRGWLQLAFIQLDGRKAASMLNFVYRDAVLVYNSGFDPDAFPALSPGIVLLAYCIQYAIEHGYRLFDFLRGDEDYKYRFGGKGTRVLRLTISK
ncbi:MAG: hypothetical protein A2Z04_04635 [Chloroflexi bacterium RBG_16_57_9]|nr:MAG: hypothetical protein A2Z04_04635 [Chloroflexi bacterium RBG_16_57_9]